MDKVTKIRFVKQYIIMAYPWLPKMGSVFSPYPSQFLGYNGTFSIKFKLISSRMQWKINYHLRFSEPYACV